MRRRGSLDGCHSGGLRALGPLTDLELNALVFLKRPETGSLDFCVVNEHVLCAAVRSDKTEALLAVEPFHSSLCHTLFNFSHFRMDVRKDILRQGSTSVCQALKCCDGARLWTANYLGAEADSVPMMTAGCSVDSEHLIASADSDCGHSRNSPSRLALFCRSTLVCRSPRSGGSPMDHRQALFVSPCAGAEFVDALAP